MSRLVIHNFVHASVRRRAYARDCGANRDCDCGTRDAWTRADLERRDVYALRNIAKHAGLPYTGEKADLITLILGAQGARGYGYGSGYAEKHAPRGRDGVAELNQALSHSDPNWGFFHGLSKSDKDLMDKLLVEAKHPLAYQPGTQENRFKALHKQGHRF